MKRVLFMLCASALAASAHAEVVEKLNYVYYDVPVDRYKSLTEALNASTPLHENGRIFHGYTKWYVHWNFRWNDSGGRCRFTSVRTDLTVTITLPRLVGGTAAQRSSFERYLSALRTHENGHYENGRNAAADANRRIFSTPDMASCRALEEAANSAGNSVLSSYNEKDRQYDRTTQHGIGQGAVVRD